MTLLDGVPVRISQPHREAASPSSARVIPPVSTGTGHQGHHRQKRVNVQMPPAVQQTAWPARIMDLFALTHPASASLLPPH